MPRRADRPPLDPTRPLVTRTEFVANGRPFGRGQPFDWRKLDIDRMALRRLYDAGHVIHPDYEPGRVPEPTEPSSPPSEAAQSAPEPGGEDGPGAAADAEEAPEQAAGRPVTELGLDELRKIARKHKLPTRRSYAEQLAELQGAGITHAEV